MKRHLKLKNLNCHCGRMSKDLRFMKNYSIKMEL